jgi:hypothetical protein
MFSDMKVPPLLGQSILPGATGAALSYSLGVGVQFELAGAQGSGLAAQHLEIRGERSNASRWSYATRCTDGSHSQGPERFKR